MGGQCRRLPDMLLARSGACPCSAASAATSPRVPRSRDGCYLLPLAGAEAHQRAVFGDPLLGADGGGALSTIVRRKPEHTRLFRFVVYNPINIF